MNLVPCPQDSSLCTDMRDYDNGLAGSQLATGFLFFRRLGVARNQRIVGYG